jgi:hypothetical protein
MKVTVWIEKMTNGQLWGRTSNLGGTFVTGYGETVELLIENIRKSMVLFQQKEEMDDEVWSVLNIDEIEFDIKFKPGL